MPRDFRKPLHKQDEAIIVRFVKDRKDEMAEGIKEEHSRAKLYDDLYLGKRPGRGDKRANVHVPKTFSAIETIVPRLIGPFLNLSSSPIKAKAREKNDEVNEFAVNAVLWWELQQDRAFSQLDPVFRAACKYGNGWFQIIPRTIRNKKVSKARVLDPMMSMLSGTQFATYEDQVALETITRPHFQYLPYWDVFPDPDAYGTEEDCYYDVIYRYWLRIDQIEELSNDGVFKNIDKLEYQKETGKGDNTEDSWRSAMANATGMTSSGQRKASVQVPLIECWRYETSTEFIVIAPQQDVVLMAMENPYYHSKKTIRTTTYIPREGTIKGIGVVEHIESLQLELDDKRNQRLDIVNLIVNPAVKIKMNSPLREEKDFALWPGRAFRVNDEKDMVPFTLPDTARPLAQEEDRIRYDMDETTATSEFIRGMQSAKGDVTATEVDVKTRQATTRFVYMYNNVVDSTVRVMGDYFLSYQQQFLNEQVAVRVTGDNGTLYPKIGPEEIRGQYDFYTIVDPLKDDDRVKVQQMMQVAQAFQQVPGFNIQAWGRRMALAMGQDPNEMFAAAQPQPMMPGMQQPQLPGSPPQPQTNLDVYRAVMQPNSAAPLQQGGQY